MTQVPEPRTFTHRSLSPHKRANDASPNEKFPSFDEHRPQFQTGQPAVTESPLDFSAGQGLNHDLRWPPRKTSQRLRDGRLSGIYTHRTRRSVSDAINKFRTRQGSVSENAQELAEALKAPVSYKLIVSVRSALMCTCLTNVDALHHLVHDFGFDEHILQVNIDRITQASHSDHNPIRLGVGLVSIPDNIGLGLSIHQTCDSSFEEWFEAAVLGCSLHSISTLGLPAAWPSAQLLCHLQNPGISGTYHQRLVAIVYSARLPPGVPHPVQASDISLTDSTHTWSYAGMFDGFLHKLLGYQRVSRCRDCFCIAKHLFEEALQRIGPGRG